MPPLPPMPIRNNNSLASDRPWWTKVGIRIYVQRNPALGITDRASQIDFIPLAFLVKQDRRYVPHASLQPIDFCWDKFKRAVFTKCNIAIDSQSCELGYVLPAPRPNLPKGFFEIDGSRTFENALNMLYNHIYWRTPVEGAMTMYLWSPRPQEPIFRRSRTFNEITGSSSHRPLTAGRSAVPETPSLSAGSHRSWSGGPDRPDHPGNQVGPSPSPVPQTPTHSSHAPQTPIRHSPELGNQDTFDIFANKDELDADKLKMFADEDDLVEPNIEDFETKEEFNAAMTEYLDQLQEREIQRFKSQADSMKCEHLDDEKWAQVCQFFGHDKTKIDATYCVQMPRGFRRLLLPVQALSVYHALKQKHGIVGSCIMAHAPGIGKTTITLATNFMQNLYNHLWEAIVADRKDQTGKHVAQNGEGKCPTYKEVLKEYGIICPCSKSSPTSWLRYKPGAEVALIPTHLLRVWIAEHAACHASPDDPTIPPFARHWAWIAYGAYTRPEHRPAKAKEHLLARIIERDDAPDGTPNPPFIRPQACNTQVFVITTAESSRAHFTDKFTDTKTYYVPQPDREIVRRINGVRTIRLAPQPNLAKTIEWPTVWVETISRDEFHDRKTPCFEAIKNIQKWSPSKSRCYYFLSGTPLQMGPADIQREVKVMQKERWKNDPILSKWLIPPIPDKKGKDTGLMAELANTWTRILRANGDLEERRQKCDEVVGLFSSLVEVLMIRWTPQSRFFGHLIVIVPKNIYSEIPCTHSEEWTRRVTELQDTETKQLADREAKRRRKFIHKWGNDTGYKPLDVRRTTNVYYKSRLCASFPYLSQITDKAGNNMRLTELEWFDKLKPKKKRIQVEGDDSDDDFTYEDIEVEAEWKAGTDSDPYFHHLQEIADSSGKLHAMKKNIEAFQNQIDADGNPAKQIYTSFFFAGAYLQYLWMIHILKIPKNQVVFLHKKMTKKEFEKRFDLFRGDLESDIPLGKQKTARYLIATSSSICTGVTLAQTLAVAFLEPDYRPSMHEQTYCRHCRQGNKNKTVYSLLFVAAGNPVEEKIMDINALRKCIIKAAEKKKGE